jgi:serine/threonine protein kinase
MELYTGDLLSFINETNDFNSLDVYIVFRQLVSAVNYLHNEKHIVHRDIKLENILFNNGDDINVVLTDFGFSMHRDPTDPLINIYSGTHDYAAPEILQHRPHRGYPADIYALGICLFAMIAKRFPNPREDLYDTFEDDDLADLLRDMLASTEDRRINIKDIINHPWMKKMEEYTESFNDSDQDDPEYYMYRRN